MYPFIRPIANLDYAKVIEEWKRGERYYDKEKEICDDDRKAECELYTQVSSLFFVICSSRLGSVANSCMIQQFSSALQACRVRTTLMGG